MVTWREREPAGWHCSTSLLIQQSLCDLYINQYLTNIVSVFTYYLSLYWLAHSSYTVDFAHNPIDDKDSELFFFQKSIQRFDQSCRINQAICAYYSKLYVTKVVSILFQQQPQPSISYSKQVFIILERLLKPIALQQGARYEN